MDDQFQSSGEIYDTKSLDASIEIYGTNDNDGHVMSERVQSLAGSVYQEFEHMIKRYDEDVVKELMPLVVGILEALDQSFVEKQENEVELELLRDDNEQLLNQYEREKQLRKTCEQKILELDDAVEEDQKQSSSKIESLESIVRMLELKGKNASDHVGRLEQKEAEMKQEYQKLHERYTELFKSHMDYQERTKMLMVSDRMDIMSSSPRPKNFASVTLRPTGIPLVPVHQIDTPQRLVSQMVSAPSPQQTPTDNVNFYDESREMERNANTPGRTIEDAIGSTLDFDSSGEFAENQKDEHVGECAFEDMLGHGQEISYDSDGNDITGCDVNPGDFASSGVGKEVENLIQENNELLATKNALNIVKDDLISRVDELTSEQEILREEIKSINTIRERGQEKIAQLEETIKKQKEQIEASTAQKSEEDDVPLVMRKRFTRVEMARVLMERNQYKERLMELQEAVRWTEMIRASREHPELVSGKKSRSSIWNFFGNLFNSQNRPNKVPNATLRFSVPKSQVQPVADPNRTDKSKAYEFLQDDMMAEKSKKERARERKEQYKQVRAHVKKDDGRMQAYGWSLPTRTQAPIVPKEASKTGMPVPVPVYCRPLLEKEPATKLWCAAGVNLSGGRTRDGGAMVGASIFYSGRSRKVEVEAVADEVEKLNREIRDHERDVKAVTEDRQLSSLVWIVTSTHTNSQVTVIDANNPGDSLDSFNVTSAHILCITSVEGALESDYATGSDDLPIVTQVPTPESSPRRPSRDGSPEVSHGMVTRVTATSPSPESEQTRSPPRLHGDDAKDGIAALPMEDEFMYVEVERFSSVLPTMWMGSQRGDVFVHSSVSRWKQCLHTVRLNDSVLSIVHVKGRVLAALADGTVAAFHRAGDGQWDLRNYHLLSLGRPQHSIRCMTAIANKNVWLGYGNRVHVVNPKTFKIETSFDAHPRRESQVRQLSWAGDGVWISIRLDSTLRLYHAYTYDHLQDVDIEPYVSKMLGTGKLGFSFVRITSLLISSMRLWIGTGNGVIISIPLSENSKNARPIASKSSCPGGVIRVYNDTKTDAITPGSFLPYCSMAQAQLSFHGHKDAVKFFTAVPGKPPALSGVTAGTRENLNIGKPQLASTMLVISGGEGYVDFRIGDSDNDEESVIVVKEEKRPGSLSHGDKSHLIVWEVSMTG